MYCKVVKADMDSAWKHTLVMTKVWAALSPDSSCASVWRAYLEELWS